MRWIPCVGRRVDAVTFLWIVECECLTDLKSWRGNDCGIDVYVSVLLREIVNLLTL